MSKERMSPKREQNPAVLFRESLQKIVGVSPSPETIDTFTNTATDKLITLTHEIVRKYRATTAPQAEGGMKLEDEAYAYYKLTSLSDILDLIEKTQHDLVDIDDALQHIPTTKDVLVPPDPGGNIGESDSGTYELPGKMPRLKTLLYVLKRNGLTPKELDLTRGLVTPEMVRKEPYVSVSAPSLHRLVLVCDEERNATFIFDTLKLPPTLTPYELVRLGKDELNILIKNNPHVGTRLIHSLAWIEQIQDSLLFPITHTKKQKKKNKKESTAETENRLALPQVSMGDLDPWKFFYTHPETGKHYGPIGTIAGRLGTFADTISARLKGIVPITIRDSRGQPRDAYAFEDVRILLADLISLHLVDRAGEWKGFLEKDGKHYGSIRLIAKRLGTSSQTVSARLEGTVPITIRDSRGQPRDAYAFEDVRILLADLISLHLVDRAGEWKGFLEKDGKHYGSMQLIAKRLGISSKTVSNRLKGTASIPIRTGEGRPFDAYAFEDIKKIFEEEGFSFKDKKK